MLIAREDLGLERLWVISPDSKEYALDESIHVIPLTAIPGLVEDWRTS
jgi:hypothetical protein